MPNQDDLAAIDGLFDRIEDAARNFAPRDRNAEYQIQQRLQQFPPAPYYMAQTILIQEQALREAQARIQQLESQNQQRGGGFLGGIFGSGEPAEQQRHRGPWDRGAEYDERPRVGRGGGGGFLAGAAQTALGVTGGVLLGSALAGMLTGDANAEEFTADNGSDADAQAEADNGVEDIDAGGDDLGGGDDFDMGGDF